jgi:hypothetical protein
VLARCETMYDSTDVGCLVKLTEKSGFEFALGVIVGLVCFQNLVEMLIKKFPEVVQWPKVADTYADMCCIMVVGLDHTGAI